VEALADYTQAIAVDSANPRHRLDRGRTRVLAHSPRRAGSRDDTVVLDLRITPADLRLAQTDFREAIDLAARLPEYTELRNKALEWLEALGPASEQLALEAGV
jgi:hypothetical protein